MRKVMKGQKPPPKLNHSAKPAMTNPIDPERTPSDTNMMTGVASRLYVIFTATIIVLTMAIAYYGYHFVKDYVFAKKIEPIVTFLYPNPPTVGRTLTLRIRFRKKGGKLIPFSSKIFQEIQNNIALTFTCNGAQRDVAVLIEANPVNNNLIAKFSLRKAGDYQIQIKYKRWFRLTVGEGEVPYAFEVVPGLPSPKYMDFGTHNPHFLCLAAGKKQYFRIHAKDEYGNACRTTDVDLEKLGFQIRNTIAVESDFCLHRPANHFSHQRSCICLDEDDSTRKNLENDDVCLKLKLRDHGIYLCTLLYNDFPIRGDGVPHQKLIACVSPEEEEELRCIFLQKHIPGTIVFSCKCKVSTPGDDDFEVFDGFIGVSAWSLVIAKFKIALHVYPAITFPIHGRTNIFYHGSRYEPEEAEVMLLIQDGLRPTVQVELEPSSARKLLVCFANYQGFVLPRLGKTFAEKEEKLAESLQSYFFSKWFVSPRVLHLQHGNLIRSTMREVPLVAQDWLLPFTIIYGGHPPQTGTMSGWLNKLCEEFFAPNEETGMFHYLQGSKLLHPRASGFSRQPLEFYHLAGKILAKAIVESILRNVCTNLNGVRFSRSLLAYFLGVPITYKCLETDEPMYFQQRIKSVLESDVTGQNYTFVAIPETPESTKSAINLVQDGSTVEVTNENKEHYLNLLTRHRLIRPVELELKELRKGFNEVLSIDKLCDYNEQDLESLISGGQAITINELMAIGNHRVVKEMENISTLTSIHIKVPPMNYRKILNWFQVAATNMSDREKSNLLFFATGSFSLPSCGWHFLNPKFTISLTGTFNKPPHGNPNCHELILGDHVNFDNFEKTLLEAITPASERILLPTSVEEHILSKMLMLTSAVEDEEVEMEETPEIPPPQVLDNEGNPETPSSIFVQWLRSFANV